MVEAPVVCGVAEQDESEDPFNATISSDVAIISEDGKSPPEEEAAATEEAVNEKRFLPPPYEAQCTQSLGDFIFSSNFDSGNAGLFEQVTAPPAPEPLPGSRRKSASLDLDPFEYHVWVQPDAANTQNEVAHRSWFYFSVEGADGADVRGRTIRIVIRFMNNHQKMYVQGFKPVTKQLPHSPKWMRIPEEGSDFKYSEWLDPEEGGDGLTLRWRHTFQYEDGVTYFAFCHPYTYAECCSCVDRLEEIFAGNASQQRLSDDGDGGTSSPAVASGQRLRVFPDDAQADWCPRAARGVYFHRQDFTRTREGRVVELLTVTADEDSSGVDDGPESVEPITDWPKHFEGRQIIFISCRVHPGETPAQYCFFGLLAFLLSDDPRASLLRKLFVFKLVPMLNPDGVALGHYRTNTLGLNLNRCYMEPNQEEHEAVWAVKEMLLHWTAQGRLLFYIDCHAHAQRRGCFLFGNALYGVAQAWNFAYAKLCQINSPHFDLEACNFSQENMIAMERRTGLTREGSGRVAVHVDCKLLHAYTMECSFHTGRYCRPVPKAHGLSQEFSNPRCCVTSERPVVYDPEVWAQVGEAMAVSLLDMYGHNCNSRLPNTSHGSFLRLMGRFPAFKEHAAGKKTNGGQLPSPTTRESHEDKDESARELSTSGTIDLSTGCSAVRVSLSPLQENAELEEREKPCGNCFCCWDQAPRCFNAGRPTKASLIRHSQAPTKAPAAAAAAAVAVASRMSGTTPRGVSAKRAPVASWVESDVPLSARSKSQGTRRTPRSDPAGRGSGRKRRSGVQTPLPSVPLTFSTQSLSLAGVCSANLARRKSGKPGVLPKLGGVSAEDFRTAVSLEWNAAASLAQDEEITLGQEDD